MAKPDRRSLRPLTFATLGEAVADAEQCAVAERAGRLEVMGEWTPGQMFGHLAWWIDGAYDGFPFRPPLVLRILGPLMKKRVISRVSKPGVRIPGTAEGTYGTERLATEVGLARYKAAVARLEAAPPTAANPVFGRLSYGEWKQLHLRHAEGHLRFLRPG